MDLISSRSFVQAARGLVGTRWRHEGRNEGGLDCIGLPLLAMSNAGMNPMMKLGFLDPKNYPTEPSTLLIEQVTEYCVQSLELIDGGLMLFQFPNDKWPRHFAIYSEEQNTMIHANARVGKVVEHGYRMKWLTWFHSIWKLPGIDYEGSSK